MATTIAKTTEQINADIAKQKAAGQSGAFYSKPTGEYTTKAYDKENKEIYVKSGEYVAGASLTPKNNINIAIMSDNPNAVQGADVNKTVDQNAQTNRDGSTVLTPEEQAIKDKAANMQSMISGSVDSSKPEQLDINQTRENLMSGKEAGGAYKVDDLKTEAENTKKIIDDYTAKLKTSMGFEESQAVPLSVIAGKNQQAYNEYTKNVSYWQNLYDNTQTKIKDRLEGIDQYIKDKQWGYEQARTAYEDDYKKAYDSITYADKELDEAEALKREAQKDAATQWTVYSNLFTDGTLDYNTLDDKTKLKINELEVRSGYPVGTLEALKSTNPNGKMIGSSTDDQGNMSFVFQQPGGELKVMKVAGVGKKTKATGSGSGTSASFFKFTQPDKERLVNMGLSVPTVASIQTDFLNGVTKDELITKYKLDAKQADTLGAILAGETNLQQEKSSQASADEQADLESQFSEIQKIADNYKKDPKGLLGNKWGSVWNKIYNNYKGYFEAQGLSGMQINAAIDDMLGVENRNK
jgi:hypothetical protein